MHLSESRTSGVSWLQENELINNLYEIFIYTHLKLQL